MTTILLVEDNEINRDMLCRRLERKGYQVIVAIDGEEAVTKTQTNRPDVVLMDLHLPILDGWEATRRIKANPETQAIPVIALTADAIAGEREKALAAGCDEYDTKPVDLARLLEKITTLIRSPISQPPEPQKPAIEQSLQRVEWTRLRRDLEQPIYDIIGYSDLLLDALSDSQDAGLCNDLQKIYSSGLQLLKLIQAILNPALLEVQQQDWTIDLLAPALRRELLTPLSTIIGYCELLIEESPADLLSDLEQTQSAAQKLLNMVSNLDDLVARHARSNQSVESDEQLQPISWKRHLENESSAIAENCRILVVDHSNSSIVRQLERQGFEVAIAASSQEVPHLLETTSYDLVLLESTQLHILEQLQSYEKRVPVLLIAAPDDTASITQGIALGAVDYLIKPIPSLLLRTKVKSCLEQTQLRKQLVHYEGIVEEFTEQKRLEADLNQQLEALQLELEQIKRSQQATEIVQTDYFQQLQSQTESQELQTLPRSTSLPLKVLLVEDNELNRDMLTRRLQRHGYDVVIAIDGAEGVSSAIAEQPNVILMDISLPVMDGWEATQQLKANPQTAHIPIIALTAHAMTGDREKALSSGCDDYDTKPIELPRLLGKIEDCLKSSTY